MSIQKKSLISTLKTAKKANVASAHELDTKGSKVSSMKVAHNKIFLKGAKGASLKSAKVAISTKSARSASSMKQLA